MAALDAEQVAVVDALVRDVSGTLGLRDEAEFKRYLIGEGEQAIDNGWTSLDMFSQKLVDDFQQRMHDEFVDVSWPRCPYHPHHPLSLSNGGWRCNQTDVEVARLGALQVANGSGG